MLREEVLAVKEVAIGAFCTCGIVTLPVTKLEVLAVDMALPLILGAKMLVTFGKVEGAEEWACVLGVHVFPYAPKMSAACLFKKTQRAANVAGSAGQEWVAKYLYSD